MFFFFYTPKLSKPSGDNDFFFSYSIIAPNRKAHNYSGTSHTPLLAYKYEAGCSITIRKATDVFPGHTKKELI